MRIRNECSHILIVPYAISYKAVEPLSASDLNFSNVKAFINISAWPLSF